ncbi:hypothetical protein GCM10011338_35510 [Alteromonas lipolytica]|uniref:Tetratricopeptide repeat protein n=2 Tax=Alteromonas lipolytica TaxID=1856405 RepID=A0A1E8F902_9ALTE|nr:hypothetical protein BFC17_06670 [Alteromonas lipolytica]GGF80145.1 hypothetical protein GCM10011338_35510 [Alteromonas lipolytica]
MLLTQAEDFLAKDPDQAEALIEEALELAPTRADVHFLCGQIMGIQASQSIFSALGYAEKSLNCLKQAAILEPENIDYQYALMMFYTMAPGIAGGDDEIAWQLVNDIAAKDSLMGTRAKLQYFLQNDDEKAFAKTLNEAITTYPQHAEFYYRQGLKLQEDKQFEQALIAFARATNATIDDEDADFKLSALYQIGRNAVFSEQGVSEGIEALLSYVEQPFDNEELPSKPWAHYRLAQLYKLQNDKAPMKMHLAMAADTDDERLQDTLDDF